MVSAMSSKKETRNQAKTKETPKPKTKESIDVLNRKAWEVMIGDPRQALELSRRAAKLAEFRKDRYGLGESRLNLGWCHTYMAEYPSAVENFHKALEFFRTRDHLEGQMKVLNALGVVYHRLSQFETALGYFSQSLKISQQEENKERQLAVLNNIGEMHWDLGNYDEALSHFIMALNLAEESEDDSNIANVLVNIGLSYRNLAKDDQALDYLNRSLEMSRRFGDRINEARCLNAIGSIQQKLGRFPEARKLFQTGLAICNETENRLGQIEAFINIGSLSLQEKEKDAALRNFLKAQRLSEAIGARMNQYKAHEIIAEIYEQQKQYSKALKHYQHFHQLEKEVFNEETERRIQNLNIQYQIEKSQTESEIHQLRNVELREKSRELEESNKKITFISRIGQEITASLDLKEIMDTVYQAIKALMDASVFGIALYNSSKDCIEFRSFVENAEPIAVPAVSLKSKNSFAVRCFKNQEEILMNDVAVEYRKYIRNRRQRVGSPAQSLIYLPLSLGQKQIGVLTVQSFRANTYTESHVELLRALASYIAIALENSRIHEQLSEMHSENLGEKKALEVAYQQISHMANHDNLTALPNRRLLKELFDKTMQQADRRKEYAAILYIDLDRFKPVNDNHGHEVGDEVLKVVAERLLASLRAMDIVARIGGDEFLAVLQGVGNQKSAERVAEKIIRKISEPIEVRKLTCHIGASIGICFYPADGRNLEELIRKGDAAMYRAKEKGRGTHAFLSDAPLPAL
jgi:diguanylate cyclase (GGDEF)-like protein